MSGKSIGFGLSAFSKVGNVFYKNTDNFKAYKNFIDQRKIPLRYLYKLSKKEKALVYLISKLRKGEADLQEIEKKFKVDLAKELSGEIKTLVEKGLIMFKNQKIIFSEKGFTMSSSVTVDLLKNWGYLGKLTDSAFNFIDNLPNLEEFIKKNFVFVNKDKYGNIIFASPDRKGLGILMNEA